MSIYKCQRGGRMNSEERDQKARKRALRAARGPLDEEVLTFKLSFTGLTSGVVREAPKPAIRRTRTRYAQCGRPSASRRMA